MPRIQRRSMKNKRWYVNATVGKSVPFIGGTGIKFGSGNGNQKRSLASAVKDIVRKGVEATHYKVFDGSVSGTSLLHNTFYTVNLLGNIPRGDNWNNRNGDIIHLSCMDLNLHMYGNTTQTTSSDITFKYWVLRDTDEYLGASDAWGSGVGGSKLINVPNYITAGIWDPKRVSVVSSGSHIFKRNSSTQTIGYKSEKIMICPDAKFTFETGTNFGKPPNYYLVIASSVYNGSSGVTSTGAVFLDGMIKFKNSQ